MGRLAEEGDLKAERLRLLTACGGVTLWFAYPFVEWFGGIERFRYRCSREPVVIGRDPCFSDYIPILELIAFVLTLGLAYFFARFAFSLFAPAPEARSRGWRFASRSAGSAYFPSLQLAAGLGILWALLHLKNYPVALYPYLIYWGAWLAWFGAGIWLSWPSNED
jgi:hypothetical protein